MNASKSYAKAVEVGEVMTGGTVGGRGITTQISRQGTWWSATEAGRNIPDDGALCRKLILPGLAFTRPRGRMPG